MDIRKLQRAIVDGLEDVKAQNIAVFNTEHLSPLFERVIIASGTSNRQTKALAASVRDAVKGRGFLVMRTEGEDNGEWIIVDCGAAVAHIMQPAIRDYYHLEEIWGSKPVKMKIDGGVRTLPKAEVEPPRRAVRAGGGERLDAADGPATTVAKKVAKKVPKKAVAKKTAAKTTSVRTVAKAGVTRTTGTKSPAGKATGRTPPSAKAVGRKTPARKAPARKSTARKSAARV